MNTLQTDKLLTRREAAKMFRVCLTTFDRMRLPAVRIGRRVFYRLETINAWITAAEQHREAKQS